MMSATIVSSRGFTSYAEALRQDAPFHAFVALYVLVGTLIAAAAGVAQKSPIAYSKTVVAVPLVMGFLAAALSVVALLRSRNSRVAWSSSVVSGFHPQTVAGLLLLSSATVFLSALRGSKGNLA